MLDLAVPWDFIRKSRFGYWLSQTHRLSTFGKIIIILNFLTARSLFTLQFRLTDVTGTRAQRTI